MAKKKNAGSYARGAVPRRSADRKADHALRPFLKEDYYGCNYLHHQHWKRCRVCAVCGVGMGQTGTQSKCCS